jgi:hypothetical protein
LSLARFAFFGWVFLLMHSSAFRGSLAENGAETALRRMAWGVRLVIGMNRVVEFPGITKWMGQRLVIHMEQR